MPTLTLELPDDLYERLRTVPEKERPNFAVAWMRRGADAVSEFSEDYANEADLKDACAKIAAGLADFDAGRSLSLEEAREQSLALFDQQVAVAGTNQK